MTPNLVVESPAPNIRVARFVRPDVRDALYDQGSIVDTTLFKELRAGAIDLLPRGGTLVLNFGLIDWFPTVFYSLLLRTLEEVRAKDGKVVVCCLPPNVKEGFELMGGPKMFEVQPTELRAVVEAKR